MNTAFFPFANPATYGFFRWLTENNTEIDTGKLVVDAFDRAQTLENIHHVGNITWVAERVISDHLQEMIDEVLDDNDSSGFASYDPPLDGTKESLSTFMAAVSFSQIEVDVVAKALLRVHQKWSPPHDETEVRCDSR